ncbi:hypothetical protein H8E77_24465 [bacterium]|nr:hypothetical protein [bacterium]
MKRLLIPTTLLFILLIVLSCGNSDNILSPETDTVNDVTLTSNSEAGVWSEVALLTAPKKGKGNGTLIGPAGGTVDAGNNSYLLVHAGALTEDIAISAQSTASAIATDPGAIEQNLQDAITLIENQANYIQALPKKDDGSGEWIKTNAKNWLEHRNGAMLEQVQNALANHQTQDGWEALLEIMYALQSVDDFEWDVVFQPGTVGPAAETELLSMCVQIRGVLQLADALYESTLLFQFAPHGTQFLIAAELVVPLDEVTISDEFAWYSGDGGDTVQITLTDYFVDEVEGTVHYLVNHFSEYYFNRR